MARFNALLGRKKFPVPLRRELGRKPLYLALNSKPIVALEGPDEQNSLYFSSYAKIAFDSIALTQVLSLHFNRLCAISQLHQRCCCRPVRALDQLRIFWKDALFQCRMSA